MDLSCTWVWLDAPRSTGSSKHTEQLFKSALEIINKGEHVNYEGLQKIAAIKASMNTGKLPDEFSARAYKKCIFYKPVYFFFIFIPVFTF